MSAKITDKRALPIRPNGMKRFLIEVFCIFVTVCFGVYLLDRYGVFAYDQSNNHTAKRWEYLYRYRGKLPIDVMVLGNSHAYTGLLPEELSRYLGKTCFILASQGNFLTDAYYMLKEALEISSPRLLIIETYLIRDYDQGNLKDGDLTCQIQSFEARRNLAQKLASTYALFTFEQAPYAWSSTLRNHSYIFDNPKQLSYNLKHPHSNVYKEQFYLGRYIRFLTGLGEQTLERYRTEGAPVDGREMTVSEDAFDAMDKIAALCRDKGVRVMFLTLPMYREHVSNYDAWKHSLNELISRYDYPWLDLQQESYFGLFGPECFEDTYRKNQHMTAAGAQKATYVLSRYCIDY